MKLILLRIIKFLFITWLVWGLITANASTFQEKKAYQLTDLDGYGSTSHYSLNSYNIVSSGLSNSNIILLTAHPDDESMFFTPTLMELSKQNYNNSIHLLCLSDGNYDGLGQIRARELKKASDLLGLESYEIGDLKDDISVFWDTQTIIGKLNTKLKSTHEKGRKNIILTFDKDGVSDHPNHKSLNAAVVKYVQQKQNIEAWTLKSWNFGIKYSGFILTNLELISDLMGQDTKNVICSKLSNLGITFFSDSSWCKIKTKNNTKSLMIYSDINGWFLGLSTMTWAHYSQMVWFRWGWVLSSKYMNSNELIKI